MFFFLFINSQSQTLTMKPRLTSFLSRILHHGGPRRLLGNLLEVDLHLVHLLNLLRVLDELILDRQQVLDPHLVLGKRSVQSIQEKAKERGKESLTVIFKKNKKIVSILILNIYFSFLYQQSKNEP